MKKTVALLLAACMLLAMTAAVAEVKTFDLTAVTNAEAGIMVVYTDEGVFMVDGEGNMAEYEDAPVMSLVLDDEALTCIMTMNGEAKEGTIEIVETNEEAQTVTMTLTIEGDAVVAVYAVAEDGTKSVSLFVDDAMYTFIEAAE